MARTHGGELGLNRSTSQQHYVHHRSGFALRNSTRLVTLRLLREFGEAMRGWPMAGVRVWVRHTRGAEYSGTCYPQEARIYINLSPTLRFPYRLATQVAPGKTQHGVWRRPLWTVMVLDACDLATFIFLHECYHWLLHRARRNGRQKEAMCDRFGLRYLVDHRGAGVCDEAGRSVPRGDWDVQDLDGFVRLARVAPSRKQVVAS
jgi:hypothetical protein